MELKPCPVCGKRPSMEYSHDFRPFEARTHFRYVCCGIVGEPSEFVSVAIEAWNRCAGEGEKE